MNYIVDHIPKNTPHNRRPGHPMAATTITIHNTGNPTSTAKNERAWLTNPTNPRTASFHIAVDERDAVEVIPLNENAWAAGDGANGPGNRTSIHIEICESGNYAKAVENAAKLTARLLHEREWEVNHLRRHWDWNQKICPRLMYDGGHWTGWHGFIKQVMDELKLLRKPVKGAVNVDLKEWQWDMLHQAISDINVQIDKAQWLDKIKKKSITNDELTWLNTILIARANGIKV